MSKLLPELQAALANPNVQAFLRVIREGETDQTDAAYRTVVGGSLFEGFDDHPRKFVRIASLGVTSSAAGAYQFLSRTWDECAAALQLPDFSPPMQDLAAVFLIRRRGALQDVIAGRLAEAIRKCNLEWASLPGSPYGQPTKSLDRARAVYAQWGGQLQPAAPAPQPPTPAEASATPPTTPAAPAPTTPKGRTMAPAFLWGLAQSLITAFTPLAREKIEREVARHTDKPEVAEQVATAVLETAKAMTGKPDPIEAVAAAKADPEVVQQLELDALAVLDRLAPVLDKMHAWDKDAWAAEEASRTAAALRAQDDPDDQDPYLTRSIVRLVVGILIGGAVLTGFLAWQGTDVQVILGALLALVGAVGGKFQTRYDHRYGSSRGSGAKDVVLGTLAGRPPK
jgi:muramidase (phage lysozyme)